MPTEAPCTGFIGCGTALGNDWLCWAGTGEELLYRCLWTGSMKAGAWHPIQDDPGACIVVRPRARV